MTVIVNGANILTTANLKITVTQAVVKITLRTLTITKYYLII